jgi:hypothetical protein
MTATTEPNTTILIDIAVKNADHLAQLPGVRSVLVIMADDSGMVTYGCSGVCRCAAHELLSQATLMIHDNKKLVCAQCQNPRLHS